jgi:DNA adenine methylase
MRRHAIRCIRAVASATCEGGHSAAERAPRRRAAARSRERVPPSSPADELELGFATFYLNRTNRSGILNANPIGGLKQTGRWKIDARFRRADLVTRIRLIGRYRNRIEVEGRHGNDVSQDFLRRPRTFLYIDPPYLTKGAKLYLDALTWAGHDE